MKIGGNYIDKEGKGGTVKYLPRSGLLEQMGALDRCSAGAPQRQVTLVVIPIIQKALQIHECKLIIYHKRRESKS